MINFDPQHFLNGIIVFAVILFFLYRRVRRNFGRQKLNRGYMIFRMVLLSVLGALLLIPTLWSREAAVATLIGAALGIGLALWAAKHTRFLNEDGVLYYIPHSYTGIIVTALFVGRLVYKIAALSKGGFAIATMDTNMGSGDFGGLSGIYHNPLNRLVFFIVVGYYVYYYAFVLRESKDLKPGDMETPAVDKPGGNI